MIANGIGEVFVSLNKSIRPTQASKRILRRSSLMVRGGLPAKRERWSGQAYGTNQEIFSKPYRLCLGADAAPLRFYSLEATAGLLPSARCSGMESRPRSSLHHQQCLHC